SPHPSSLSPPPHVARTRSPLPLHLPSLPLPPVSPFFFSNDPPPPEIYTLSLHDALPISRQPPPSRPPAPAAAGARAARASPRSRSEEHTSELQSLTNLVCRLLLEKKKKNHNEHPSTEPTDLRRPTHSCTAPHLHHRPIAS